MPTRALPRSSSARRRAAPRESSARAEPALLISLHWGLTAGGVTTWAVRLANALARGGRRVALMLHAGPPEHAPLPFEIDPAVEVIDLTGLPGVQATGGDPAPFLAAYLDTVERLSSPSRPLVMAPSVLEECYGLAAAVCQRMPERVRVVGIQHADDGFHARVMGRYEPIIARYIAVSRRIGAGLRAMLPHRAADVVEVPYGVPVAASPPPREPARGRPLRLVYAGRMEHHQKRVRALVHLSEALRRRGVAHELRLIGDGPAAAEVDALIADRPAVRRLGAVGPGTIAEHLDWADAAVLASRYEGLSVSMLEAMGRGCVPIVTDVGSGIEEAIEPGVNAELARVPFEAEERDVGEALAKAVARFARADGAAMSRAAWRTARERFSIERHAGATAAALEAAAAAPARRWPLHWPCVLGAGASAAPPGAAARLSAVLESLAGRRVVVHGVGRHTLDLAPVLATSPARIVAFTDDDPQRHGGTIWNWAIVAPAEAGATGATDVVISSHTFEGAIWSRRGLYERQGLCVHRVYGDG